MSENLKVVALGGGHGLAATLTALRSVTKNITAVVTIADNGGSSGRLRAEFPIFPPGDLRMALAALCSDDEWGRSWAEIMQYRFTSSGPMDGHAVGNLLLAALWDKGEDSVAGLDRVGELLKIIGRVLPMAAVPLDIAATFKTSQGEIEVQGQKEVATAKGELISLRIIPSNPEARSETLDAIAHADLITMGPGSWFSSVLPHLLVPAQREALINSKAKKVLLLNLDAGQASDAGEYAGQSALEHLRIVKKYAPELHFDYVVVDPTVVGDRTLLGEEVSSRGGELLIEDLRDPAEKIHHSPEKLTSLFAHIAKKILIG
jgi:uncharacterized cofD-like protein